MSNNSLVETPESTVQLTAAMPIGKLAKYRHGWQFETQDQSSIFVSLKMRTWETRLEAIEDIAKTTGFNLI